MEVKTRVLLLIVLIVYKVASENHDFGRMKNFACRYQLYFRRKNVEAASIAGIFSWNTWIPQNTQRVSSSLIGCILHGMG